MFRVGTRAELEDPDGPPFTVREIYAYIYIYIYTDRDTGI